MTSIRSCSSTELGACSKRANEQKSGGKFARKLVWIRQVSRFRWFWSTLGANFDRVDAQIFIFPRETAPREKSGIGKTGMVPDSEDDLSVQCLRGGKSGPRTCMSKGTRFHIVDARDQGDTRTKRRMRLLDSSSRKEERERQ